MPASEPVQAEAVAPTPASAAVPATDRRARKGERAEKPVPAAEARALSGSVGWVAGRQRRSPLELMPRR